VSGLALDLLLQAIPVGFVMFLVLNFGGLLTWVERKQSAIMQDRIGANRASISVLGFQDPVFSAERAEQVFNALVSAVPAFGGMTYRSIGDAGAPAKA